MDGLRRSLSLNAMPQASCINDQPREKLCIMHTPLGFCEFIIANLWGLLQPASHPILVHVTNPLALARAGQSANDIDRPASRRNTAQAQLLLSAYYCQRLTGSQTVLPGFWLPSLQLLLRDDETRASPSVPTVDSPIVCVVPAHRYRTRQNHGARQTE